MSALVPAGFAQALDGSGGAGYPDTYLPRAGSDGQGLKVKLVREGAGDGWRFRKIRRVAVGTAASLALDGANSSSLTITPPSAIWGQDNFAEANSLRLRISRRQHYIAPVSGVLASTTLTGATSGASLSVTLPADNYQDGAQAEGNSVRLRVYRGQHFVAGTPGVAAVWPTADYSTLLRVTTGSGSLNISPTQWNGITIRFEQKNTGTASDIAFDSGNNRFDIRIVQGDTWDKVIGDLAADSQSSEYGLTYSLLGTTQGTDTAPAVTQTDVTLSGGVEPVAGTPDTAQASMTWVQQNENQYRLTVASDHTLSEIKTFVEAQGIFRTVGTQTYNNSPTVTLTGDGDSVLAAAELPSAVGDGTYRLNIFSGGVSVVPAVNQEAMTYSQTGDIISLGVASDHTLTEIATFLHAQTITGTNVLGQSQSALWGASDLAISGGGGNRLAATEYPSGINDGTHVEHAFAGGISREDIEWETLAGSKIIQLRYDAADHFSAIEQKAEANSDIEVERLGGTPSTAPATAPPAFGSTVDHPIGVYALPGSTTTNTQVGGATVETSAPVSGTGSATDPVTIADGAIGLEKLNTTGTRDSTTILYGDGAYRTAPTGGGMGTGDITRVTAGTGLSGGGDSGAVTINISNGGVGTTQLADDAVTSAKLADDAVDSEHIVDGAIDITHLSATGTADSTTILYGDGTWKTAPTGGAGDPTQAQVYAHVKNIIVGGTGITATDDDGNNQTVLSADALSLSAPISGDGTSANPITIADGAIEGGKLANATVTGAKLANATITSTKMATGAASNAVIASNAVTTAKIANDAVTDPKLEDSVLEANPSGTDGTALSRIRIRGQNYVLSVAEPDDNVDTSTVVLRIPFVMWERNDPGSGQIMSLGNGNDDRFNGANLESVKIVGCRLNIGFSNSATATDTTPTRVRIWKNDSTPANADATDHLVFQGEIDLSQTEFGGPTGRNFKGGMTMYTGTLASASGTLTSPVEVDSVTINTNDTLICEYESSGSGLGTPENASVVLIGEFTGTVQWDRGIDDERGNTLAEPTEADDTRIALVNGGIEIVNRTFRHTTAPTVGSWAAFTHAKYLGEFGSDPNTDGAGNFYYNVQSHKFRVSIEVTYEGLTFFDWRDMTTSDTGYPDNYIGNYTNRTLATRHAADEGVADGENFVAYTGSDVEQATNFTSGTSEATIRKRVLVPDVDHIPYHYCEFWGTSQTERHPALSQARTRSSGNNYRYQFATARPNKIIGGDLGIRALTASEAANADLMTGETLADYSAIRLPAGVHKVSFHASHTATAVDGHAWLYEIESGTDDLLLHQAAFYTTESTDPFESDDVSDFGSGVTIPSITFDFSAAQDVTLISNSFDSDADAAGVFWFSIETLKLY